VLLCLDEGGQRGKADLYFGSTDLELLR